MTSATLNKIKLLPAAKQQEVEDFVNFLLTKYSIQTTSLFSVEEMRKQNLGRLKGKIKMSEDFNQTPSEFQDYI